MRACGSYTDDTTTTTHPFKEDAADPYQHIKEALCRHLSTRLRDFEGEEAAAKDISAIMTDEGIEYEFVSGRYAGQAGLISRPTSDHWGRQLYTYDSTDCHPGQMKKVPYGLLYKDVAVKGPLSYIDAAIPSAAEAFLFNQPTEDKAIIESVTANVRALVKLHRPHACDAFACIQVQGGGVKERSRRSPRSFNSRGA